MRLTLKNSAKENAQNLMRKAGYFLFNQGKEEFTFIRPLEKGGYPRFHIYVKMENSDLILNLHLDQKKPIYKGAPAHAGEYEGSVVEKEAERIKELLISKL